MEAKTIRARARENLAGNWALSVAVAVVACLLGGLITGSSFLPTIDEELVAHFPELQNLADYLHKGVTLGRISFGFRDGIFGLAAFLLGGVLQLGYARFLLNQHDGKNAQFGDLFSQFDRFGAGFVQFFLITLYTALWSLLFIIPGIIAALSYAMTPFIMAENPDLSPSEAIAASKELMDGHKMDLFILDLTFIGWTILAGITGNLGHILLNPYVNAAYAAFYRQILAEQQHKYIP